MPFFVRKLKAQGWLAKDMYKKGKKMVVDKGGIAMAQERSSCDRGGGSASDESSSSQSSMISPDGHPLVVDKGGIAIIFIAVVTFFLAIFIFRISFRILGNLDMVDPSSLDTFPNQVDYLILLVVAVYAMFGILDDYIELRHRYKMLVPFFFALPLTTTMHIHVWTTPLGTIDLLQPLVTIPLVGTFTLEHGARFIVLPIYIMVAANLVNMHAGFNGLMSGLSLIMLVFILIKAMLEGLGDNLFTAIFAGALGGFLYFNFFPATIFEGNIGANTMGAAIGVALVTNHFFIAGCILFLPHFINFLLYLSVHINRRLKPKDKRYRQKFGKVRTNNTLKFPGPYSLSWVPSCHFKLSEKQAVLIQYSIAIIFGIIFLLI